MSTNFIEKKAKKGRQKAPSMDGFEDGYGYGYV
jgi:hypothetical protein